MALLLRSLLRARIPPDSILQWVENLTGDCGLSNKALLILLPATLAAADGSYHARIASYDRFLASSSSSLLIIPFSVCVDFGLPAITTVC